jgi:signal transduction histidine kinase
MGKYHLVRFVVLLASLVPLRTAPQSIRGPVVSSLKHKTIRYVLAVFIAVASLYLRSLLTPLLGESNPYLTAWLAVVLSSWYCGLGPAIVGSAVCVLGIDYFFLSPLHSLSIETRSEVFGIFCFLIFAAAIIALGESNRRTALSRKRAEAELKAANGLLEQRVSERTTKLNESNENVRELSARLLQLRDEERRRIARELHDSVGQLLAAMSMNNCKLEKQKGKLSAEAARCVEENSDLLTQALTEVRTISHLLHPPLLDEIGLESAVRWFIKGFAQRSHIDVSLTVALGLERLVPDLELAIFRILQECLTNIHRHSEGKTATIHLDQRDGCVHCEISDDGKGIPLEKRVALNSAGSVGVGLRGMRERISQLGGVLQIHSSVNGTTVQATLPVKHAHIAEDDRVRFRLPADRSSASYVSEPSLNRVSPSGR